MDEATALPSPESRALAREPVAGAGRIVLIVLVCWLVLRLVFFEGFWGSDDLDYIRFATLWNHAPATHWEARLIFVFLLRASIRIFGSNPLAWNFPNQLASLLLLSSAMLLGHRLGGSRAMLASGLIAATAPIDVIMSTVAYPNALSSALAGAATFFVIDRRWKYAEAGSVVAAAFCILVHSTGVFYVLGLGAASWLYLDKKQALRFSFFSLILFFLLELGLNALVWGDPLVEFRILRKWIDPDPVFTRFSAGWFLFPIRTFLFSKDFTWLPLLSLSALALPGLRMRADIRCLVATSVFVWFWFGYGSAKPQVYEPFWRLTRFDYLCLVPLCAVAAAFLTSKPRLWRPGLVLVCASNLLMLSLSGQWGQADDISREFLSFVKKTPDAVFLTDYRTWREIFVLNGCRTLPNLFDIRDNPDRYPRGSTVYFLRNPLNIAHSPKMRPSTPGAVPPPHLILDQPVFATDVRYRPIALLLPHSLLARYSWFVRRPAGEVLPVVRIERTS